MNLPKLSSWLREDSHAVALSSGFFGFYAHAGFMAALMKHEVNPSRLLGCSAGALIAAFWAAGLSKHTILDELHNLKREHFWDPGIGAGLLKGERFQQRLQSLLPVQRVEDCPIPLGLTVFDAFSGKTKTITHGNLATAIRASCAVPIMFQPVWIRGRPHFDGGIGDPTSLSGLPNNCRVLYHHLPPSRWWAKADARNSKIPQATHVRTVYIGNLPKVGPFRLQHGKEAFDKAYRFTNDLLQR